MTCAVADWLLHDGSLSSQTLIDTMVDIAYKYPCPMGGYGGRFYRWLTEPETLCEDVKQDNVLTAVWIRLRL